MDFTNVTIETERLLLVTISPTHREDIFREFTKEITKYMFPQPTGRIEDVNVFISDSIRKMKEGNNLQLVALDKNSKEFLGCVGLHNLDQPDPEMGIWLKKTAHGNGYGLEAMKAVKKWADENLQYEHIKYSVAVENIASRKIPEALGGKVVRESATQNQLGEEFEEVEYWISK